MIHNIPMPSVCVWWKHSASACAFNKSCNKSTHSETVHCMNTTAMLDIISLQLRSVEIYLATSASNHGSLNQYFSLCTIFLTLYQTVMDCTTNLLKTCMGNLDLLYKWILSTTSHMVFPFPPVHRQQRQYHRL